MIRLIGDRKQDVFLWMDDSWLLTPFRSGSQEFMAILCNSE
jgi:hypothetical protein